jgi:hypothetical protein
MTGKEIAQMSTAFQFKTLFTNLFQSMKEKSKRLVLNETNTYKNDVRTFIKK